MRRIPSLLLLAAALASVTGYAGASRAEDRAPDEPAEPRDVVATAADASSAPAAPAPAAAEPSPAQAEQTPPAPAAPAAATPTPNAPASPVKKKKAAVAGLAPAGTIDASLMGGAGGFPLHATASLSNSFGQGILAPGFQSQPQWGTSLFMNGSAALPKADFLPRMVLSTGVGFSVSNWLPSFTNGGVYDRQVRASDVSVGLAMPGALTEEFTKIRVGLNLNGRVPTSITSRQQNLFTSLGASVPVAWVSPDAPWGQIGVFYSLGGRVNLYTADAATIPCEAGVQVGDVIRNPLANGDLPVAYGRAAELTPDGQCILRGRQSVASVTNNLGVSWNLKQHSVSASLGWSVGFLRPLASRPDLASEFATGQNFNESTNGNLSYTYAVPVEFPLSISAGVGSGQAPYDPQGNFRFPFWDFFNPAQNFSAAFVDVSVGI